MTHTLGRVVVAAAVAVTTVALSAAPAQAVSYRKIRTIAAGYCLRPSTAGNTLDVRADSCSNTPTTRRDWQVISKGTYNGHPLWQLKNRSTGRCLVRFGTTGVHSIAHYPCVNTADDYWEVFTVSTGKITLKSYGAFANYGAHVCLMYLGGTGGYNTDTRTCNTASTLQQWRS